jgi:predicted Zn-dependent peptidase
MHKVSPAVKSVSNTALRSKFEKTVLSNGLRIVTEEIPYVRSISIGVWINAGSRDENENNNGISHFLEHMVFKGTKNFSALNIARSLESVGGYLDAFTTKEHTCFYARILDEHLPNAVKILSDLIQYPLFRKDDIEKEKQVVLEELKNIEDDPDDLIHDYFERNIFSKHPLGYPVIGNAKNILDFTKNDLTKFMQSHYVHNKMVIAAAGNIKHEKVVELIEKNFSSKNGRINTAIREKFPQDSFPKNDVYEKPITQAHVCMGTIGYSVRNQKRYPLILLNTLLGEGMSSRLFQNIREKSGFAYNVYSFASSLSDTGNFGVYIGVDQKKIEHTIELVYSELKKLALKPISDAELKRTKSQVKGSLMLSMESMSGRMMRLASGELYLGQFFSIDDMLEKIESVTSDKMHEVAQSLFKPDRFSTVIIKPSAVQSPAIKHQSK